MAEATAVSGIHGRGGEQHLQVVFSLHNDQSVRATSVLDEEREKHRRRAERFGTQYMDPGRVRRDFGLMMEARKERSRASHGFTTGNLDVFSPEEREKRAARAARFHLEAPLAPSLDTYKPDEELEARARRAVKFGVSYQPADAVLMDMDLYEQRREVGKDVERRPTAIYLYGVDVMSTKEVLSYFSEYGPVFVEWLDDSSCNVLFDDSNTVKRALVGKGTPLPQEVVTTSNGHPQQQQQGEGNGELHSSAAASEVVAAAAAVRYQPELPVPENLVDVANLPFIWHKGHRFLKEGTEVPLVFRMATVADVRNMVHSKQTRKLWKEAGSGGAGWGRSQQRQRRSKRPHQQGLDGATYVDMDVDMDVDDDGGGPGEEGEIVPKKRRGGPRGGQRLVMRELRQPLQPYGGVGLLQVGGAVLPAKGHVLDYTELEDEYPAAAAAAEEAVAGRPWGGNGSDAGGGDRGRRRRARRSRGKVPGRGANRGEEVVFDLREVLRARRPRLPAPAQGGPAYESGEDYNDGRHEGKEGTATEVHGRGIVGHGHAGRSDEGDHGGQNRRVEMDE